jgi:hypothetical protein
MQTKMKRLEVGDVVAWMDWSNENSPVLLEGPIRAIANEELTYILVDFDDGTTREVTEDEVTRIS